MKSKDEESAVNLFLAQMHKLTVSLVRNAESFPINSGLGSGVLIPAGEDFLLLTAGHLFDQSGPWTLETSATYHGMTLHLALRDLRLLDLVDLTSGKREQVDLAWAKVTRRDILHALKDSRGSIQEVSLPIYRGPLDVTVSNEELYGYAASNRAWLDANVGQLVRETSYEVGMSLRSRDNTKGLIMFDLARKHQGDDYYKGASGAPIADCEGQIIALLLSGDTETDTVTGIELSQYAALFPSAA